MGSCEEDEPPPRLDLNFTQFIDNISFGGDSLFQCIIYSICLGEQLFKHAEVLSKRKKASGPGGPKSMLRILETILVLQVISGL